MTSEGDANTLYAWQVFENDEWGTIAAKVAGIGDFTPLIHRSLLMIRRLEQVARNHGQQTGLPVRLAKFTLTEVIE